MLVSKRCAMGVGQLHVRWGKLPRRVVPRVCFVKRVNSLLGTVFVSLLWFQDSLNPVMLRFNAYR